jgi:broad specificity phosphatase PhoE
VDRLRRLIILPMSVELVYETHSLTTDNENGVATGWLDGLLSEAGKQLAARLGERRRDDSLAAVFTSDLRRAVETVEIAFVGSDVPVFQDPRLRECDYGLLNGMPVSRLVEERLGHIEEPWPEGESYRQVVERVANFLDELPLRWEGTTVLVIGHSATQWRWNARSMESRLRTWSQPRSDGKRDGCTGLAESEGHHS